MMRDITIGQYFPGNTIVHRLDPRTKLILVVVYIVALFIANTYLSYAILIAVVVAAVAVSKVSPGAIVRNLKPLLVILILTVVLNVLYTDGRVLVQFWIFKITAEGISRSIQMLLRIVLLITGTFLLTYTTSPIALTDGIELLFSPLRKLHVPVHELAMMMSIALRFIPTLIEEADKIMSAQKARGASFDTGRLTERARALVPLLVPLFISAFRRADELAVAMECRCYHGGEGRTRMKVPVMRASDWLALLLGAALLALIVVLRHVPLPF